MLSSSSSYRYLKRSAAVVVFDNCNATSVTAFVDVLAVANQLWQRDQDEAGCGVGPRELGRLWDGGSTLAGVEPDRGLGPVLEPVPLERRRVEISRHDRERGEDHAPIPRERKAQRER